MSLTEPPVLLL